MEGNKTKNSIDVVGCDKSPAKLYRVFLRGLSSNAVSVGESGSYVVANDPTEAYLKVKRELDRKNYGFTRERELDRVEFIAEAYDYTNAPNKLYL